VSENGHLVFENGHFYNDEPNIAHFGNKKINFLYCAQFSLYLRQLIERNRT